MDVLVQNIPCEDSMYSISAPNKCGQLILNIDEDNFTEVINQYLGGVVFHIYYKTDDDEYIEIQDRGYVWSKNSDLSLIVLDIPESCYVKVQPTLNKLLLDLKKSDGTYLYPELQGLTELPVSLMFDDTNIPGGSGGGGTQYEDADNKEYPLDP